MLYCDTVVKNLPASGKEFLPAGDVGSIPGSGRSPGKGNGNPFQYSCLRNPMVKEAWWASMGSQRVRHYWTTNNFLWLLSLLPPCPISFAPLFPITITPSLRLPHIHGCRHCLGWLQQHLSMVWSSDLPTKTGREIVYWSGTDTGKRRQDGWAWREESGREKMNVGSFLSSIQVLISPPSLPSPAPCPLHTLR